MIDPRYRNLKMNAVPEGGAQSAPVRPKGAFGGPPRRRSVWDALKVIGGTLQDLDGSMGYGHREAAMQGLRNRNEEMRQRKEAEARKTLMAEALKGMGMPGLESLSPEQMSFIYGMKRDQVGDARNEQEFDRRVLESDRNHAFRSERADRSDMLADRSYKRGVLESDRSFIAGRDDARYGRMHNDRMFGANREDAAHGRGVDAVQLAIAEERLGLDRAKAEASAAEQKSMYSSGEIRAMREKGEQLTGFKNSLDSYLKAINESGVQAWDIGGRNEKAARLDAMRQDLLFQGKNLWELGVLSKDDYVQMERAIPDATGLGVAISGKNVALQKASPLQDSIDYQLNRIPEEYRSYMPQSPALPPGVGTVLREQGPAIGAVEDGHRFIGGNPADPNSWERVS